MAKCSYNDTLNKCALNEFKDGYCIFHYHKNDINKTDLELFVYEFDNFLENQKRKTLGDEIIINGFYFPYFSNRFDINKSIKFINCTFNSMANFSYSIFSKNLLFKNCIANEDFNLQFSSIKNELRIENFNFKKNFDISYSKIESNSYILDSRFENAATFNNVHFKEKTLFSKCLFEMSTFSNCLIEKEIKFSLSLFMKYFLIENPYNNEKNFYGGTEKTDQIITLTFDNSKINPKCIFEFESINLSKSLISDLEIFSQIQFKNCKWPKPPGISKLFRKNSIYDEFFDGEVIEKYYFGKTSLNNIEKCYHNLVIYYERCREHELSEDFYIAEMEILRKRSSQNINNKWLKKFRNFFNVYTVYLICSRYGSSYFQSFIVLISIIMIFSILLLLSGLTVNLNDSSSINYSHVDLKLSIRNFFISTHYIFSSILPYKLKYVPSNAISELILSFSQIFIFGQTALILFAVRRRFKR